MRTRTAVVICFLVALMVGGTASRAAAKGGWGFYLGGNEYLLSGRPQRAEAIFPASWRTIRVNAPYFAYAVPASARWHWEAPLPRGALRLEPLHLDFYRLRGREMVRADVTFTAPRPGDYELIACDSPCTAVPAHLSATPFTSVANRVEARLHEKILEERARGEHLGYRLQRSNRRVTRIDRALGDHLGHLSNHVARIIELENEIARLKRDRNSGRGRAAALALFLGGGAAALGGAWARAAVRRRYRRAHPR
jgi:uncharacterized small protein (DUF1192 family)